MKLKNGSSISDGVHEAANSIAPLHPDLNSSEFDEFQSKDPTQNLSNKPKPYLNYMLCDDMFNLVNENSGVKQEQRSPNELQTLGVYRMDIKKTGFL